MSNGRLNVKYQDTTLQVREITKGREYRIQWNSPVDSFARDRKLLIWPSFHYTDGEPMQTVHLGAPSGERTMTLDQSGHPVFTTYFIAGLQLAPREVFYWPVVYNEVGWSMAGNEYLSTAGVYGVGPTHLDVGCHYGVAFGKHLINSYFYVFKGEFRSYHEAEPILYMRLDPTKLGHIRDGVMQTIDFPRGTLIPGERYTLDFSPGTTSNQVAAARVAFDYIL